MPNYDRDKQLQTFSVYVGNIFFLTPDKSNHLFSDDKLAMNFE